MTYQFRKPPLVVVRNPLPAGFSLIEETAAPSGDAVFCLRPPEMAIQFMVSSLLRQTAVDWEGLFERQARHALAQLQRALKRHSEAT